MRTKRFTLKVSSYIFLYEFIFAYSVYNYIIASHGFSDSTISIVLGLWALAGVVFEIPSGIIADKYNRKTIITIAPLFKASTFLLWTMVGGSIWIYILGFTLWSLGSTLITGTYQAYIYDYLAKYKKADQYEKVMGKVYLGKRLGTAFGLILGGLLASISLELPLILSTIPLVLGVIIATRFDNVEIIKSSVENKYAGLIKSSIQTIKKSFIIQFSFITIMILGIRWNLDEYDQLYFDLVKLPLSMFGVVLFISSLLSSFIESQSYRVKTKKYVYFVLPFFASILLFLVGYSASIIAVVFLITAYIVLSPINILADAQIQREIDGGNRATVVSFSNFMKNGLGIIFYFIFAGFIEIFGLGSIYIFSGSMFALYAIYAIAKYRSLVIRS